MEPNQDMIQSCDLWLVSWFSSPASANIITSFCSFPVWFSTRPSHQRPAMDKGWDATAAADDDDDVDDDDGGCWWKTFFRCARFFGKSPFTLAAGPAAGARGKDRFTKPAKTQTLLFGPHCSARSRAGATGTGRKRARKWNHIDIKFICLSGKQNFPPNVLGW